MSYRFRASQSVRANVRRVARDRLDDAIEALEAAARGDDVHEQVHRARKRAKQVRALTRLVRGSAPQLHDEVNTAIRDAARRVSALRDREALLETLDDVLAVDPIDGVEEAVATVRAVLEADRDQAVDHAVDEVEAALGAFRTVREGVGDWTVPDGPEAITGGFAKTYGRGRRALEAVREHATTEALHEWRKRVKYHRHHVELLEALWPPVTTVWEAQLHRLSDLLGDDHDLAVLRGVLEDRSDLDPDAVRVLAAVLDRRRAELQQDAVLLGRRLFALEPDVLTAQVATWWAAWQDEATAADLPHPLAPTSAD